MPGTSPTISLILATSAAGVDHSYSVPLTRTVGVACTLTAAASPSTFFDVLAAVDAVGHLAHDAGFAGKFDQPRVVGKSLPSSAGWMSLLNKAAWKRRNASIDSSATQ